MQGVLTIKPPKLKSKMRDCSDGTDGVAGHVFVGTTGPSRKCSSKTAGAHGCSIRASHSKA